MPTFRHDGINFAYVDRGEGLPVLIQHGLGGDTTQPTLLFQPPPGFRVVCLDARGHGETRPLGPSEKLGIGPFADDLLALLDHLGLDQAVVGGISMGAAVALNFAVRNPERLLALILSRPAWLDQPLPPNLEVFPRISRLLIESGAQEGHRRFLESEDYQSLQATDPAGAQTLAGHFLHPRAEERAILFDRIARDTPIHGRGELSKLSAPTLVLAGRQDPIHPFEYGEELARLIPGAQFRELTPKSVSPIGHGLDARAAFEEFLSEVFPAIGTR